MNAIKKALFNSFYACGGIMSARINPAMSANTCLPKHLLEAPLLLNYGEGMAVPIRDLDVSDEGIGGTMLFNRVSTWTFIPWETIFLLSLDDGGPNRGHFMFIASAPASVLASIGQAEQGVKSKPAPSAAPPPKPRGFLKSVD